MYKCSECDTIFEELIEIHEPGGCYEADYGVYSDFESHNYYPPVEYMGCPHCKAHADDCYELVECERCGELVDELWDGMCDCCHDDMFG